MKTISDIHLTEDQQRRKYELYQILLGQNVPTALAGLGASIILQDELLGCNARTPQQQAYMRCIRDIFAANNQTEN